MEEIMTSLSEVSVMAVCLDEFREHDWNGRLYVRSEADPCTFQGTLELLEKMEEFYDRIGFPQASMSGRSFSDETGKKDRRAAKGFCAARKSRQAAVLTSEQLQEKRGEKATFIVRIQYRQRATWQGRVTWVEKDKTVNFRSALELLKLINSSVDEEVFDG